LLRKFRKKGPVRPLKKKKLALHRHLLHAEGEARAKRALGNREWHRPCRALLF
jgi:hypothetical protein